jgi:hypothetical protein
VVKSASRILQAKKKLFLEAYAKLGTVFGAAQQAGVERTNHYQWLKHDKAYAAAFAQAENEAIERLEQEARRRAYVGWDDPVFQGGKQVGTMHRHSDVLLIFLLNAARPEKYRQPSSSFKQTVKDGEVTTVMHIHEAPSDGHG